MFLTSLICVALICNVFAQELIDEFTFTGFTGAGFAPAGVSGRLDSNSTRVFLNAGEKTEYGESRSGSSFANGLVKYVDRKTYSVQGGIGAIELSNETTPNVALHLQPAGSDFSPGYVEFRFPFDKAADSDVNIVVTVFFDFWYFNRQPRGSKWSLLYATGNKTGPGTFTTLPSGYFETPHEAGSLTSDWEKQTLELEYGTVLPKTHDYFYLRFEGDDLEGSSGGRDPIALDNVGVIAHTCELGEANCKCKETSPKCDGDFECDASSTCSRGGCTSGNGLGCPCANSTRACDTDLQCTPPNTSINVCTPGGCLPGAPECICLNNGKCQETNCGTDKPGFCDPVKCPATNALLEAECKEKCPNGHTRCLCFGGARNITCATAATTAVTTAASASIATQTGSTSATTAGSAGTATNTPYSGTTGLPVTTSSTEASTMTTEPALDCGASTCAQCLETVGCGYCGDQFVGICGDLSKALSCQFKPLENKADCPVVEPPATPTPPSPTTTSGATVSSTTAEESIATLNSIALSAMFLLLATLLL